MELRNRARFARLTFAVPTEWAGKRRVWSAKVAHLARHATQFGTVAGPVAIDMATVRQRKRDMVDSQIAAHLQDDNAGFAYSPKCTHCEEAARSRISLRLLEQGLSDAPK